MKRLVVRIRHIILLTAATFVLAAAGARARDDAASAPPNLPAGIALATGKERSFFVDSAGMTLYRLNARQAQFRSGLRENYCIGDCTKIWTPAKVTGSAVPVGGWTIIKAPDGSEQWAYQDDPVFTFRDDKAPGATAGDGYDDLWSVIQYVPPPPTFVAPSNVTAVRTKGGYVLADAQGHALYVRKQAGDCRTDCAVLKPFTAGLASHGLGAWTVSLTGDWPGWDYRGKPVYVSQEDLPGDVPADGVALRP